MAHFVYTCTDCDEKLTATCDVATFNTMIDAWDAKHVCGDAR